MKRPIRNAFMAAFAGALGPALVAALVQRNTIPLLIWCATLAAAVLFGEPEDGNRP